MNNTYISDSIKYIGVDDTDIDLFESQYIVPNGVSYNSYLILDEKNAVMDTVDARKTDEWFSNLNSQLAGRNVDYLIISHLEPDHSSNIKNLIDKYPNVKLVLSAKAFAMLPQFFDIENLSDRCLVVKDGDELDLGSHKLKFIMAPMVHWPEVMVEYEVSEKILFSADGFGKFGALSADEDWACEARRYYFNIVGKYGAPVQTLLKKASTPEDEGVLIACASIHGNTKMVAEKLADILKEKGCKKVAFTDLARDDMAEAIEDAFRYDKLVLAAATYDGGVFPPMEDFLNRLAHKNYQKRKIGIIENGSWAPMAGKSMKSILDGMKDLTYCENMVTIKSTLKDTDIVSLEALANELI